MSRIRCMLLAAGFWGAALGVAISQSEDRRQSEDRPAPPRGAPDGGPRFHVLPPQAQRALNLTSEQNEQIKALEDDLQSKMQKILTPEQLRQWAERQPARPGERGQDRSERGRRGRDDGPPADRAGRDAAGRDAADSADAPPRRARDDNDDARPPRQDRPRNNRDSGASPSDQPAASRGADGAAGGSDGARRGPGRALQRMVDQLDLSDEQRGKVQQVLKEHGEMIHDLFRQARVDLLKRMKEVLNEEQYAKFEKTLDQGPPGARRGRGGENGGQRDGRRPSRD